MTGKRGKTFSDDLRPEAILPTTPLRLEVAAKLAFPDGSIGASALRAEARRGNLQIETIANKQFTTLQAIKEMRKKCGQQKGQGFTLKEGDGTKINKPCGSSATARIASAQAALKANARKLSKNSANTSPKNIKSPATVNAIPPKS